MADSSLEPDCYVKVVEEDGSVRWVACMSLGLRAREDEQGDRHIEVLVRPIGALTMAWVHANLSAAEVPEDVEVAVV